METNSNFINDKKNNDLVKVKEDAINIQIMDLQDTIKSIENENQKSQVVLGLAGVLFSILLNQFQGLQFCQKIIFLIPLIISIIISLFNIKSKKVKIHTQVNSIFVNGQPNDWETYLNNKHLHLNELYTNAKKLLYQKANCTKIAYIFLILSIIILAIIKTI